MAKREYDDDDGRTIVDMSFLGPKPMLGGLLLRRRDNGRNKEPESEDGEEKIVLTRKERRMVALGAMKASLLVGCFFMGGLALVLILMFAVWRIF